MKRTMLVVTITGLLMTLACFTANVNIYFPPEKLQEATDGWVEEIHGKNSPSIESDATSEHSMFRNMLREIPLFESQAYAQVDITVTNPTIRALLASMKERLETLRPLYEKGVIGEANDGLLSIRSSDELGLKEKADVKKLVKTENSDRENLFSEFLKANDRSSEELPEVKKSFAESKRKVAEKGWWIQNDDGEWVKKDSQ